MQVAVDALLQQIGGKTAGGGKNPGKVGQGNFMLALLGVMQQAEGQGKQGEEKSAELQLLDMMVNLTASADHQQNIKQAINGEQAAEMGLLLEGETGAVLQDAAEIKLPEFMLQAGATNNGKLTSDSAVNVQQVLAQIKDIIKAAAAETNLPVQEKNQLLVQTERLIAVLREKPADEVQAVLQKELTSLIKTELSAKGENQFPRKALELLAVLENKPAENVLRDIKSQLSEQGTQRQLVTVNAVNNEAVNTKQPAQVISQNTNNTPAAQEAAAVQQAAKEMQNAEQDMQGSAAKNLTVKSEPAEKEMPVSRLANNPEADKPAVDKPVQLKTQQEPQGTATQPFQKEVSTAKPETTTRVDQLPSKLLHMVKEMNIKQQPNSTTMRFKLHPEHLGEVTIRLSCTRGEINAQFYAATAQAKEALEALIPQIRDALVQQQVKLTDATVFLGQGNSQWSGQQQGRSRGSWRGPAYGTKTVEAVPIAGNAGGDRSEAVDKGLNLLV